MRYLKKYLALFLLLAFINNSYAKIWLPSIISDNMVLQQESSASIWGWTGRSNETITVIGSWNNIEVKIQAYQGSWLVNLPTPTAGGPYTITIKGHEEITIQNVLIGEVWICSGQSNMEWIAKRGLINSEEEIQNANYSNIRFFTIPRVKSLNPQDNNPGNWTSCTSETMPNFSSVAYFFGRKLHKDLSVPIGLVSTSWGGTPIETWIPKEVLEKNNELLKSTNNSYRPDDIGAAYNAMIHPITKYTIAGAIWYQGESNRFNPNSYYNSFPLLISSWRKKWNIEFPFYFVQIAPFNYKSPKEIASAIIRDAQLQTMLRVNKTGMVVTNDIGNINNIHPTNKQDVGKRLALWALAKTYDIKDIVFSGPVYKSMEIKKKKIIINFNYAQNGLIKKGKTTTEFFITGEDQIFYEAKAKIVNNTVEVSSSKVKKPIAVRFAFSDTSLPNLFNKAGLPASAFRTDNWEINLLNEK